MNNLPAPESEICDSSIDADPATAEAVASTLTMRRTVHKFQDRPVPESLVDAALEHAVLAPNHRLSEPWRFYRLGPATAARMCKLQYEFVLAEKSESAATAKRERWASMPGWLVVTQVLDPDPVRNREDYAACCCAMQNFMLYLWPHGVGVKWSTGGLTRTPGFYQALGIDPAKEQVVGVFWFGYPLARPKQPARKPASDVARRLP